MALFGSWRSFKYRHHQRTNTHPLIMSISSAIHWAISIYWIESGIFIPTIWNGKMPKKTTFYITPSSTLMQREIVMTQWSSGWFPNCPRTSLMLQTHLETLHCFWPYSSAKWNVSRHCTAGNGKHVAPIQTTWTWTDGLCWCTVRCATMWRSLKF